MKENLRLNASREQLDAVLTPIYVALVNDQVDTVPMGQFVLGTKAGSALTDLYYSYLRNRFERIGNAAGTEQEDDQMYQLRSELAEMIGELLLAGSSLSALQRQMGHVDDGLARLSGEIPLGEFTLRLTGVNAAARTHGKPGSHNSGDQGEPDEDDLDRRQSADLPPLERSGEGADLKPADEEASLGKDGEGPGVGLFGEPVQGP